MLDIFFAELLFISFLQELKDIFHELTEAVLSLAYTQRYRHTNLVMRASLKVKYLNYLKWHLF